jgi:cytochrome c-type biogenesis protein CcmH/NrfG
MAEMDDATHQPEKAVTEYQAAIQQQPSDPELYEALGGELQLVSRFADAAAAYRHELALDPGNSTALYNLGEIQIRTGNTAQGIALLQKALARHAPPAPANFYLGLGLQKLGHSQQAIRAFATCLASHPSAQMAQRAWYELARLYRTAGQTQNARHAIEQFQKLRTAAAPPAPAQP